MTKLYLFSDFLMVGTFLAPFFVEKIGKEVFCSKINGDELLLHISSVLPVSSLCLADSWRMMTVYCRIGFWGEGQKAKSPSPSWRTLEPCSSLSPTICDDLSNELRRIYIGQPEAIQLNIFLLIL